MTPYFAPWCSETGYRRGFRSNAKLLIVGESHYNEVGCEPCNRATTREIVERHIDEGHVPFLSYVEQISAGADTPYERAEFWHRAAFMNFVQKPMQSPQHRPSVRDFRESLPAFWVVLGELAPDLVFIFSSAYNYLPAASPLSDSAAGSAVLGEWCWSYPRDTLGPVCVTRFNHRNARNNPPIEVWKGWAERVWHVVEGANDG